MAGPDILIVGGGGREHALAWKLARDLGRPRLFCAPGNPGTAACGTNVDIPATDLDGLLAWARERGPALTIIGPEAPLCAGIADVFSRAGLAVFGPSAEAARLEGSKAFAKEIMDAAGVPTAAAKSFSDLDRALAYARGRGTPLVVKADGLAAGKGVFICETTGQAEAAIRDCLERNTFGPSGRTVLVEDFLEGEEASILALVDGERAVPLASAQDHKRVDDGDEGPNTGGMGAYSPAPVVTEDLWPIIRSRVFDPVLKELRKRGIAYRGVLYAGLMLTKQGPMVLEFNCRFGDPEAQAILPRWEGDLLPALQACAAGKLSPGLVKWKDEACACVVMSAGGYPGSYATGDEITGLDEAGAMEGVVVFHAGTARDGDRVVTAGGRVLGVSALGADLERAVEMAYTAVNRIHFSKAHYRKDIAWRALKRLAGS